MNPGKDIGSQSEEEKPLISVNTAELYFLIQKWLSNGPLQKTTQVLMKELEEHNIYQKRLDWMGNEHNRSFEDMEHQFPFIRPDYLLKICSHIANTSSKNASSLASKNVKSMLKFKPRKLSDSDHNFKQLSTIITRHHGIPVRDKNMKSNIVNILRGREIIGAIPRSKFIMPKMYTALQVQRRTLGHLSAVYCLVFDSTGKYILTGADDLLVKLWCAITGRLLKTFRGAQYEISDISVNVENTLLAAGSLDHILRVWSLQTGAPVAVLTGHTAMITTVNFCQSSCWNLRYLVSTSSDGAVAFWTYFHEPNGKITFKTSPTMYQEKMRPGGAKMISAAFSPGGSFLATGSVDHNVRVYYMKGDEGPQRILESEQHTDRVDSIEWAHSGIRFISGSKDGSAIVWYFEDQQWKHIFIHMSTRLDGSLPVEDAKKLKVTMVAWDITDELFVTAVSDHTLKVWNAHNGQLQRVLTGHTDDFFVLECHPYDRGIMMSAGHDGQVFIWDIFKGEIITRFINSIEGQGVGAIYDGKWSPDGTMIALSDSHGRLITFGFGPGSKTLQKLPTELFFHTDYRPLIRDSDQNVLDEQTQVAPHLMPPPFLVDIDGNPYPPNLQKLVPGRENCDSEQLVPNIVLSVEGGQEVLQAIPEDVSAPGRVFAHTVDNGRALHVRNNNRRSRDGEGLRQSSGEWQRESCKNWRDVCLIPPLKRSVLLKAQRDIENISQAEVDEYHKQLCSRPHMINTSLHNSAAKTNEVKNTKRIIKKTRVIPVITYHPETSEEEDDLDYEDSSEYSDWVLDEGVHLEPPKRSKRRQVTHRFTEESEDDEEEEVQRPQTERKRAAPPRPDEPSTSRAAAESSATPPPAPAKKSNKVSKPHEVPEKYKPSEWLSETKPRKSPYFPQMGDVLVYFVYGHQLYVDAVVTKEIYPINVKDLPWNKMPLKEYEFVKIVGIRYEIKPPRVCCLKLALLDADGKVSGRYMTVKYHDVPDVLDFFVLKQSYDIAVSRNWSVGDKFRCMIYDEWWIGEIISSSLEEQPDSPFLCYEIKWDNGETERMSPWDLEPVDENRIPNHPSEAVPVLEEELKAILYKSTPEDWNNTDVTLANQNILEGLSRIMELAIAEPFLAPVDLNIYPSYSFIIEYPIDLSTIRSRFEYNFYRRITAAQFDIRYLASNAEKFNEKHTVIVKNARILTDLCLKVVKQCHMIVDVSEMYRSMVESYISSDNEVDVLNLPSTSSGRPSRARTRGAVNNVEWKADALAFINQIWDSPDSLPFKQPVNKFRYPDYYVIIEHPMDLSKVREKLENDDYETPYDFSDDMKLIFSNSKTYNTNPKSKIYLMTARLSSAFDEYHKKVLEKCNQVRRKQGYLNEAPSESSRSTDDSQPAWRSSRAPRDPLRLDDEDSMSTSSNDETSDDDDEDSDDSMPLNHVASNLASKSSRTRSSRGKKCKTHARTQFTDSDESFKVAANSSKPPETSSNDSVTSRLTDNDSSDSDDEPISTYCRRPKRTVKAPKYADLNSSDSEAAAVLNLNRSQRLNRKKPLKYVSASESEEEDDRRKRQKSNGEEARFLTTISSRGRIRKLTPRAQALMKK
ncbi:bromodomain and WD repeat-containing protein 1 [Coccinella septempunctata]|uniref:bromodomain and WD repeat-containing protein 1 n=1 Tax=Coccinella septempunctata TaxID=41139 RepID=UPI001D06A556|nr:bromodomain and WD repeat-containing protein 1 [Coccinella septempunctata]